MSESEVNPDMSGQNSTSDPSIIDSLESGSYQKGYYNGRELKARIEKFSNWFNSRARLCLLRCHPADTETLRFLLLNLEKSIRLARFEINRSVSSKKQSFVCRICDETVEVQPWQNLWTTLQNHPHFEEIYSQLSDSSHFNASDSLENGESSFTGSTTDDLSEDLSHLELNQVAQVEPHEVPNQVAQVAPHEVPNGLDSFKFNFQISYDLRVEETLYPDTLTVASRRQDQVADYTIQKCGVSRGVCLLCPCNLLSKGRSMKISSYLVKSHVSGQRHLRYATTAANLEALKQYHEFWKSQEPNYQAHQVYFMPDLSAANMLKCQLCLTLVNYDAIIAHIDSPCHGKKVVKIFQSPEGKLNEFYLLDMQVEIYGNLLNTLGVEEQPQEEARIAQTPKKPQPRESKNSHVERKTEEKNRPPPKCVFVKFDIDSNNVVLPNRYKEHLKFFIRSVEGSIYCSACKMTFENLSKMKGHVSSPQHKQLSGLSIPKYAHFCEICNMNIKDAAAWEDHLARGPNRHNVSTSRSLKMAEYECKTCKTVIYGDEMSLTRHIARGGKRGKTKEITLPISVTILFRTTRHIEERTHGLLKLATRAAGQPDKIKMCLESLEGPLVGIYPLCKAYPFGSRISGLGNDTSDLDVFMDIGNMYLGEENQDSQSQEKLVKRTAKLLKTFKEVSYVFPIPSARTPIIRLHHIPTGLDCDISFRHGLGVENTKFLRFCVALQPITQPFILLLKMWSKCCELSEYIPNYGLALMAVFYLQTKGYLLPVKTLRAFNPSPSLVIDGWETINYTVPVEDMRQYVKPCTESVKELLKDFFHYFSKFDYPNMVVCPLLGNTLPKILFNEKPQESLPPEMNSYTQKIKYENAEEFRALSPFCIQDPFDLSHNLTKACQHGTIIKLKTYSTLTHDFLATIE